MRSLLACALLALPGLGAPSHQYAPTARLEVLGVAALLGAVADAHVQASTLAILNEPSSFITICTMSPTWAFMAGMALPREMRPFLVIFVTWSWVGINSPYESVKRIEGNKGYDFVKCKGVLISLVSDSISVYEWVKKKIMIQ